MFPSSIPMNPEFLNYIKRVKGGNYQQGTCVVPRVFNLPNVKPALKAINLPASYDLRQLGRVTSVKNQNPLGTCWAFATYGSLESNLLPEETLDFSENHLINNHGFDWPPDAGGNDTLSTSYLARWEGPVYESDDPYTGVVHPSPPGLPPRKHVQEVLFLPNRTNSTDNDVIKQAIIDYGGVYASFIFSDQYYNGSNYTYYNPNSGNVNHAVTVVGWDDNFDKNKFTTIPPENGAFIIKNSWGTSWGDNGYFYMSYYDASLVIGSVFDNAESVSNYDEIYQYDPLGAVGAVGYTGQNTVWMANVFPAMSTKPLAAVSFYTLYPNTNYEISIYTGVQNSPTSGTLAGSFSGTIPYAGYHTVPLPTKIPISFPSNFSIVVKLTSPPSTTSWAADERNLSGYSSKAVIYPGESYISNDGISWLDMYTTGAGNMCIKAFTKGGTSCQGYATIVIEEPGVIPSSG